MTVKLKKESTTSVAQEEVTLEQSKYEKLRNLEKRISRLERCKQDMEKFPFVVLSDSMHGREPFYKQKETHKRYKPIPAIRDLPPEVVCEIEKMTADLIRKMKQDFDSLLAEV